MLPNDIHHAFLKTPDGKHHPAGRFMVADGQLHHLEDNYGLLEKEIPEGVVDDVTLTKLSHPGDETLAHASRSALRSGFRNELLPEQDLQPMQQPAPLTPQSIQQHLEVKPPSVWHYIRAGHDAPHLLEARGGKYSLDGNPLEDREVETVLANVRTKAARLRYPKPGTQFAIQKAERTYREYFAKASRVNYGMLPSEEEGEEMDPQAALAHLEEMSGGAGKSSAAVRALRRHIFEDPMVEGLGNKYAFKQHQAAAPQGTTVLGDANNFKQINDLYGHEAGDAAIRAMGSAWRDAAKETGEGKAHRFGGDEFHVQFPTSEHAGRFARALRSKLAEVPAVGGTHRLSMSLGIGHDFPSADKAVYQAKAQKAAFTPADVPHVMAHSLHRDQPGPIPLGAEDLGLTPPPVEERAPLSAGTPAPTPARAS